MSDTAIILILVGILLASGIFMLIRSVILWYFKLDQIADDLHVIANHYRQQDKQPNTQRTPAQPAHRPPPPRQRNTTGLPLAR